MALNPFKKTAELVGDGIPYHCGCLSHKKVLEELGARCKFVCLSNLPSRHWHSVTWNVPLYQKHHQLAASAGPRAQPSELVQSDLRVQVYIIIIINLDPLLTILRTIVIAKFSTKTSLIKTLNMITLIKKNLNTIILIFKDLKHDHNNFEGNRLAMASPLTPLTHMLQILG